MLNKKFQVHVIIQTAHCYTIMLPYSQLVSILQPKWDYPVYRVKSEYYAMLYLNVSTNSFIEPR